MMNMPLMTVILESFEEAVPPRRVAMREVAMVSRLGFIYPAPYLIYFLWA